MPFITEELWQHLTERREGESIMYAPTPQAGAVDESALLTVEAAKEIVNGVRNIRAFQGYLAPSGSDSQCGGVMACGARCRDSETRRS